MNPLTESLIDRSNVLKLQGQTVPGYGLDERARGAVYTRPPVVDFMLDLVGYTPEKPLHSMRLLEPSFGGGRFLLHAVNRLLQSWSTTGDQNAIDLEGCLCAVEMDPETFAAVRPVIKDALLRYDIDPKTAEFLIDRWLLNEDFLFAEGLGTFDFIVGNPPYVRLELIPKPLLKAYRATFPTMVGRADLYVPFMERALDLLAPDGKMSFICADAWTRNQYGRGIRQKISKAYALTHYVNMYGVDAFETQVGAYPSITVITPGEPSTTRVVSARTADSEYLSSLGRDLLVESPESSQIQMRDAVRGAEPWILSTGPYVSVVSHLEERHPTIVEAGCRVGIGVATGADKVYIGPFDELAVEDDRKLPLATNKDVANGELSWSGKGIVNPWRDEGGLVDLNQYPRLAAYLEQFKERLSKRHTAKGDVERKWYKTIDRITPSLTYEPKLLIPDIKGNGDAIAYDSGTLYPHHNLYFITSQTWELRALQALLRSGIAHMFVTAYSVKIGGGYLRFQAQNLKRIRIPHWDSVSQEDREEMRRAGAAGEKLSTTLLERIYRLQAGTLDFLEGK